MVGDMHQVTQRGDPDEAAMLGRIAGRDEQANAQRQQKRAGIAHEVAIEGRKVSKGRVKPLGGEEQRQSRQHIHYAIQNNDEPIECLSIELHGVIDGPPQDSGSFRECFRLN